jgi:hypothetical protein
MSARHLGPLALHGPSAATRGSGAAAAGLVEPATVTLGGAARTRAAAAESREGIAGRRWRAAVDQARSGLLGADAGAEQPGHLNDPLPTPEPSPDRVADLDRRGRLGPRPVDLHVPRPARRAVDSSTMPLPSAKAAIRACRTRLSTYTSTRMRSPHATSEFLHPTRWSVRWEGTTRTIRPDPRRAAAATSPAPGRNVRDRPPGSQPPTVPSRQQPAECESRGKP